MTARYWLIKSEPAAYGWDDLVRDGETLWDGVRNHRAAMNLRTMKVGEMAFFYHSVTGKEIVGVAEITEGGLTDPKDPDGKWAAVRIRPVKPLDRPVTLAEIKADTSLAEIELVRQSRLSVAEIRPAEWERICSRAKA
ncbi:MAG TPA: EVE domain-containing protein [Croceibacterium sp.]